jgi:hypothetical protein
MGGLAGDGSRFNKTFVGLNQLPTEGVITAIGFYGRQIQIGHGLVSLCNTPPTQHTILPLTKADLAIMIGCIGRNPEQRNRTEEEVHAVNELFGTATCTTGFYSYGEISPLHTGSISELHNQTMTITTFTEL